MTRKTGYSLGIFLSVAVLCSGVIIWLLATPGGAQWLMESLSRRAGIEVGIVKMEGSMLGGLDIEGLQMSRFPLNVSVGDARLSLQPLSLFAGQVTIKELRLREVRIRDERPESKEPPDLSWPLVSGLPTSLRGAIRSLVVKGLVYERLSEPPLEISVLSGSVLWRGGFLDIKDLLVVTTAATVKGEVAASLLKPSLKIDLAADMSPAVAGMKQVTMKVGLIPAHAPEQATGPVTVVGTSSEGLLTEINGEIGLTVSSLNLRRFSLKQSDRKGNISGEGELVFHEGGPLLRFRTEVKNLDLSPELRAKTDISGSLTFEGSPDRYGGHFSLSSTGKALYQTSLTGSFGGDGTHVKLTSLKGSWLDGSLSGEMDIGWKDLITLKGSLEGTGLDPARVSPDWSGRINFVFEGEVRQPKDAPIEGHVSGRFLDSRLRGRALRGEFEARMTRGDFVISALDLHGRGFDIHAAGELKKRITFAADIRDLSGLAPGTRGSLSTQGWLSFHEGIAVLAATGRGRAVSTGGLSVSSASFDLFLGDAKDRPLRFRSDMKGLTYGRLLLDSLFLEAKGTLSGHAITAALRSPRAEATASLQGSYRSGSWRGKLLTLAGKDGVGTWRLLSPADLHVSGKDVFLSPIVITGNDAERLELSVETASRQRRGDLKAVWKEIRLSRIDQWLTELDLKGETSGEMEASWRNGALGLIKGSLTASGTLKTGEYSISFREASSEVEWSKGGLLASLELVFSERGRLSGRLSSSAPVHAAAPEMGKIKAEWREINPSLFQPFFPRGVSLKGSLSGKVNGNILPGRTLDLTGNAAISGGSVSWQREKQQFEAELKTAVVNAIWRGDNLSGTADLTLSDYGRAHAQFQLPLPARIAASVDPKGTIHASIEGRMREMGLLTSIFPGMIQESHGEIDLTLAVDGKWKKPDVSGTALLKKAGAYLPAAGITLKEVALSARLAGDRIFIDSFSAESGPGNITGKAEILLRDWMPAEYRGSIKGNRFQTVYLPELQILSNPELDFEGDDKKLSVRGEITVPELTVLGREEPAPVKPSKDVIIVDAPKPKQQELPFSLDLKVRVTLGEKAIVKAAGLDMQLGGSVDITAESLEDVRGKGAFRIVKGKYITRGVALDITRGRFTFDGPADNPAIDILAERKIEDVSAGVLVTGNLERPVVKLYSRPPMAEPDIMAYLVLGRPLGSDTSEVSLVADAAGLLLSGSDSASFQGELKQRLGLDTLDIQEEKGTEGVSRSLVTIGKYLTPSLYVSYGRSLFTDANLIRLRYKFSKQWELETQSGTESGADVFYTVEFR